MTDRKVIGIFEKDFPIGAYAWHKQHQYCQVMEVHGNERLIKAVKVGLSGMVFKCYQVYVKELSPLDILMQDALKSMGIDFINETVDDPDGRKKL